MGKGYVKLAVVGLLIALAMALSASIASHRATQSFIAGAEGGFGVDGMYASDGTTARSMAILADDYMKWQLVNGDGEAVEGCILATSDPNFFNLVDGDGKPCGSIHLAYASKDGMDGILYVSHDGEDFMLRKTERRPGFVVDQSSESETEGALNM